MRGGVALYGSWFFTRQIFNFFCLTALGGRSWFFTRQIFKFFCLTALGGRSWFFTRQIFNFFCLTALGGLGGQTRLLTRLLKELRIFSHRPCFPRAIGKSLF